MQVLHKSRLSVVHQVVLVWRSSIILRIIKSRRRRVWIRAKIVYVEILIIHQATVVEAGIVKGSVGVAADRSTSVRELASCIWFVWFVQCISMIVSSLLPTTTYGRVIAAVVHHVTAARAHRGEVTYVERAAVALHPTHIAMDGLLAGVMATSVVEPSLVELVGGYLAEGVLVFSSACAKVSTIALMDRVASSTRSSLLSQLCFSDCL